MKHIKTSIVLGMFAFLLSACASKTYQKQESKFIVFKTATLKYADLGFVYENSDEIKVELYGNGQALRSLVISKNEVCMSTFSCMDKKSFNRQVLDESYPQTILENIFRGKPIFKSKNLKKIRNGFTQKIINENKHHIEYKVLNNEIIFNDTMNHIIIKVKK